MNHELPSPALRGNGEGAGQLPRSLYRLCIFAWGRFAVVGDCKVVGRLRATVFGEGGVFFLDGFGDVARVQSDAVIG